MTDLTVTQDALGPGESAERNALGVSTTRRRSGIGRLLDPSSSNLIYIGVAVMVVGFVLLAIGWSSVAAEVDVWRQMPYVLSAGLPGVSLVMTGLVLINVAVRRQDGANRRRETMMLAEAVNKLQRSMEQR
jgi:hypothetical protein